MICFGIELSLHLKLVLEFILKAFTPHAVMYKVTNKE